MSSVWSRMAGALAWGGPEATYMPPPMPALYEEDSFAVQARIIRRPPRRKRPSSSAEPRRGCCANARTC